MIRALTHRVAPLILLGLSACAIVPVVTPPPAHPLRATPAPSSINKSSVKEIIGGTVRLGAGPYTVMANAAVLNNVIYLDTLLANRSDKYVAFGPESVSLTDARGVLLRRLDPQVLVQPYIVQAQNMQVEAERAAAQAQAANQALEDLKAQEALAQAAHPHKHHDGDTGDGDHDHRDDDHARDEIRQQRSDYADSVERAADQTAGAAHASAASADEAAQVAQTAADVVNKGDLQSRSVPPGVKSKGVVYFADSNAWPLTLRVLVDKNTLAATLMPAPPRAVPPQSAVSQESFLTGKESAEYHVMAKDLRRSVNLNNVHLEAIPLVPGLVKARENWRGFKDADDAQEVAQNAQTALAQIPRDQLAFEVMLGGYHADVIASGNWSAMVVDSTGHEYPMQILPNGRSGRSKYNYSYYSAWFTVSGPKVDLTKPFQLTLIPGSRLGKPALELAWQSPTLIKSHNPAP